MKEKFDVTGMTCSACSSRVEKAVNKLDGITNVSVNLLTNSMQVEYEDTKMSKEDIIAAVVHAGYGASVQDTGHHQKKEAVAAADPMQEQLKNMKFRLIVSFAFLIPLMYISMGHMAGLALPGFLSGVENAIAFGLTQFLLCLPIIYVNRNYFIKGYSTLFHGSPNMDSLIAIGSTAAMLYGIFALYRIGYGLGVGDMDLVHKYHMDLYFESAGTILALITLGKYLETRSKGKTSEAITKLMDMAPKTAIVERDGVEIEIPVEAVVTGDIIVVKPGQSVPADGVIIEGSTSIDEAAITGESIPVFKEKEDAVIAATINKTGFIKFRATKVGEDTTFSQIIRLVEEASSSKAPIAKLADKIAGIFVPVVITIAVAACIIWLLTGASFEFALSIGISVLVISCPCALGLATPVAIMVGTGKGAENGILIKSGEALETAHSIKTIVLDKTGTITQGKPQVTDIISHRYTAKELMRIAAGLEKQSEHPLAEAIMEYARQNEIMLADATEFESITGKGLKAQVDGTLYYAGNERLLKELKIDLSAYQDEIDALSMQGKTPLIFTDEREVAGVIAVADVVKPTSRQAIEKFKKMGLEVIMLTGDNKKTANAIKQQLNIDTVIAEVLPQDKENEIAKLQANGKKVAMVGDGINDAPALARADVGLAIGAGTDVAIESADIVLMKNDLLDAVTAIKLSKAVIRNIKENLFWAFFYNSVGIPLAAGVFYTAFGWKLNPMFGAAAMSLSSVCVVSNALRLKFFKKDQDKEEIESIQENQTAEVRITEVVQTGHGKKDEKIQSRGQAKQEKALSKSKEESQTEKNKNEDHKEEFNMLTINIEGMSCNHCKSSVEKALRAFEGVEAEVSLEEKKAYVKNMGTATEEQLKEAVIDAGFEVVGMEK
ncbi:MAG: heavy metal translocating P-type ATPase [Lachnospiraceae bacterium]|nr:heavy metal translocating P-type ATPase [Lachnospiraceae bacterium]